MPGQVRSLSLIGLGLLGSVAAAAPPESPPSFLHTPVSEAPMEPLLLQGTVRGGTFAKVVARIRGPGEPYQDYPLERISGDRYRGLVPAARMVSPGIEYYIEGVDKAGEGVALFASANRPHRVIVIDLAPVYLAPETAPKPNTPQPAPKGTEAPAAEKVEPRATPETVEPSAPKATRASPKSLRAELEEELAVYRAEAPGGGAPRIERSQAVPYMPTVLGSAQLRQWGVRYVHEALDLVPGLSVSRDVQGSYLVAVRGLRSDPELLFTLNGQPLNNFYDGKALGLLPVDNLERIEIFRGPAAAEVGLGNAVGVINLVTRREGLSATASAGFGQTYDGHVSGAKAFGPVSVFGDLDVAAQGGIPRPVHHDGLDSASKGRPKQTSDKRLLINGGGGASLAHPEFGNFDVSGRFVLEDRSALIGLFDAVGPDSKLEWMTFQAQLGWHRPLSDKATVRARAWFDFQNTKRLWQLAPDGWQVRSTDAATLFPEGVLERVSYGVRGLGLTGQAEVALPMNNRLVGGLSIEDRWISAAEVLSNAVPLTDVYAGQLQRPEGLRLPTEDGNGGRGPAADRLSLGLFATDVWSPLEVVSLQVGFRFDLTQLPRSDSKGQWQGQSLVPSFGPRLGLVVSPLRSLVLRGSYGRSFRPPTPLELADPVPNNGFNQGRFVGNPELQPAYFDSVEAGAEYLQGVGDGQLRLKAGAFFERVTNAIVQIDTSGNLVPHRNRLQGVQALGLEAEGRLELPQRLSAWVNASWVRAEDLTAPTQSRILTDVPQIRMNGGLSVPVGTWLNIDLVGRFASERRNNSRSVLELVRRYTLPGNVTFTAQLRTEPLFEILELMILGQNVFNFDYFDDAVRPDRVTSGVPREGWQAFARARVGF